MTIVVQFTVSRDGEKHKDNCIMRANDRVIKAERTGKGTPVAIYNIIA